MCWFFHTSYSTVFTLCYLGFILQEVDNNTFLIIYDQQFLLLMSLLDVPPTLLLVGSWKLINIHFQNCMRRKTNSSWSCIFSKGFDSGEISSGRVKHNNKTSSMVSPIHKRLRGFAVQLFRDISPKSSTPMEENITKNIQLWQVIQEADHPPTEREGGGTRGYSLWKYIEIKHRNERKKRLLCTYILVLLITSCYICGNSSCPGLDIT